LPSIALPGGVTNIGDSAFQWCYRLTNATLPNGLLCLGDAAFSGTSLNSVIIPSSVTNIGDSAFEDCTEMTEVTIPACGVPCPDQSHNPYQSHQHWEFCVRVLLRPIERDDSRQCDQPWR
jgi:hypothetical protein